MSRIIPFCDECPPLKDWPDKNVALGNCPRCGRLNDNHWREAAARQLVRERAWADAFARKQP